MSRPAVELDHIGKTYREGDSERAVLRDVSVAIAPGEIAVLVGRSGSGKSTRAQPHRAESTGRRPAACSSTAPTSPRSTRTRRTRFRRRRIGFVFQFFNLIPVLTVEENLLLPLELNGRADAAGRRAGARAPRSRGPRRPRGELCRSGCREASSSGWPSRGRSSTIPRLVLADEPTGTLDAETAASVLALLDALARESGKTVVMVTHSREVVGVADRIFAVERGRLVEQPALPSGAA